MNPMRQVALLGLVFTIACGCGRPIEEVAVTDKAAVSELPDASPADSDWPWWRGINLDGKAVGPQPVTEWSEGKNILWKASVPGAGHASPIVWGEQVFVATADESAETQSLVCFDRATGEERWTTEIHRGGFMHRHAKNSHASSTPACDGERVFTVFMVQDGIWVSAVGLDGKLLWQEMAGPFRSMHGYGSSPVLYKSLVIVAGDNQGSGFLAALHRRTGKLVWRVARKNDASFGTPIVAQVAGKTQLLLSGQDQIVSYNPETGKTLWTSRGPASTTANTMAFGDDVVYASGGYPQNHLMAVKADGSGEVIWENDRKGYVPSLLLDRGRLYLAQDDGIVRCFNASSGVEIWVRRLGGGFSASPVLAGEQIYLTNEQGATFVFKASETFELLAENQLGDSGMATMAICDGRIYLRTADRLYCIGKP